MNITLLKEYTTTAEAGYMGAVKTVGSKSYKFLYGAELSKEVKAALQNVLNPDLKKSQILAKIKTYSGGQHLTITLKLDKSIYGVSLDEYKEIIKDRVRRCKINWIWDKTCESYKQIFHEEYYKADAEGQKRMLEATTEKMVEYNFCNNELNINHYYINDEALLNEKCKELVNAANEVILAFNKDDSNSMVDYFDTNFYYDIKIKWI